MRLLVAVAAFLLALREEWLEEHDVALRMCPHCDNYGGPCRHQDGTR